MATVTEPTAEVKPRPFTYQCGLKSCEREEGDYPLVLCWSRDWANWGVVRNFRLICLSRDSDGYTCFRPDLYHFIPLRSETGEYEDWLDNAGFFDDPEEFIGDLVYYSFLAENQSSNGFAEVCYC